MMMVLPRRRGGFSPADIANLVWWLDADDSATITTDTGGVSQWNDKSASANNATQTASGNRPDTGTRTINGRNALNFIAVGDDGDAMTGTRTFTAAQAMTIIIVSIIDDPQPGGNGGRLWSNRNSSGPGFLVQDTNALRFVWQNTGAVVLNILSENSVFNNVDAAALAVRWDGSTTAANVKLYINGVEPAYSIQTGGTALTNADGLSSAIGRDARVNEASAANTFVDKATGEILVYSRELSNAEMNQLGGYLSNKWGISWTNIT